MKHRQISLNQLRGSLDFLEKSNFYLLNFMDIFLNFNIILKSEKDKKLFHSVGNQHLYF